jgi:hypothetical protein
VEISFDVKSELWIEFSFLWFSLPFINVHDIPLLVDLVVLSINNDVSVFSINVTLNFDNLTLLVDNGSALILEELPPS